MNYSELKQGIQANEINAITTLFDYVRNNKQDMLIKVKREYLIKQINAIKNGTKTIDIIRNDIAIVMKGK